MPKPATIADLLATAIESGDDDIQAIIDSTDFPSAAVRTIASTGDFRVDGNRVRRVAPDPATWFTDSEAALIDASPHHVAFPVMVTAALLDGAPVTAPLALGNYLSLARGQALGLRTTGITGQVVKLNRDHVVVGPIDRQLVELGGAEGDEVQLVFGHDRSFEVRRG